MTGPEQNPEQHFERFRRSGDAAALAAVFDAVAPELLLVAAHVAPNGVEPEDLLQATFVDAIEHAGRWDAQRRLMPWLIGVLVQHARVERRRLARRVDGARLVEREVDDPAQLVETADLGQRVAAAVASMPVLYRQVLTLRLVHALTPTQIAAALGCPVATVKTRLQRGMELLRGTLPAGLASAVALLCFGGRGMAQVKAAVLAKAGAGAVLPAAAAGVVAAGWLGGTIAMKKFAVAVVALVCLALAWSWSPWSAADDVSELQPAGAPLVARGEVLAAPDAASPEQRSAAALAPTTATEREAVSAETGSAALTFVWQHDHSPASGLFVTVRAAAPSSVDVFDGRIDRRGQLRLDGLQPGDYRLFGFRLSAQLTVLAGQRVEQRFEVEAGLRCDGIVVDGNGVGVAGADVFLQYFPDPQDREPRWLARSGADGTFRCATDYGGSFWARKAGRVAGAVVSNEAEGEVMLRLELGGVGATLRGLVTGADGRGVAAAHVLVLAQGDPDVCPAPVEVVTDRDGAFVIDELVAGAQLVVVEAAGHAASATPIEVLADLDNRLDVQMVRGATIEGHVRDRAERPLRARVAVRPAWAGSEDRWAQLLRPLYLRCVTSGDTADDGSYRLEHVPVGAVEVFARAGREVHDEQRALTVADGVIARCDFWLVGSGPIRGRLVDPVGEPLAGWTVVYEPIGGGRGARGVTHDDGTFAEAGLDAERYRVTAAPPDAAGGVPWAVADDVGREFEVLLRAVCRPEQGGRLIGRALGGDGAPARRLGLGLTVAGARQGSVRDVAVDGDGSFVTGLLPVGRLRITAHVDDEGGVDLGERDVVAGLDVDLGELRVPGRGMLELRFVGADGARFAPDELRIFGAGGNRCEVFDEVRDGAWRSAPVPAGRYTLMASGADFVRVLQPVEVAAGSTTPVEVAVAAACTVRFELQAESAAAAARRLSLQVFDAQEGSVGAAGSLLLEPGQPCTLRRGYAAGHYRFVVRDGGREVASGRFAVGAADAPEVVVAVSVAG